MVNYGKKEVEREVKLNRRIRNEHMYIFFT